MSRLTKVPHDVQDQLLADYGSGVLGTLDAVVGAARDMGYVCGGEPTVRTWKGYKEARERRNDAEIEKAKENLSGSFSVKVKRLIKHISDVDQELDQQKTELENIPKGSQEHSRLIKSIETTTKMYSMLYEKYLATVKALNAQNPDIVTERDEGLVTYEEIMKALQTE